MGRRPHRPIARMGPPAPAMRERVFDAASGSGPRLAAAAHDVFEGGELGGADRAARVQPLVEMPISAPMPNSPPSANWVEALHSTIALSTSRKETLGGGGVLGHDGVGVVRAVALDMGDRRRRRRRPSRTARIASRYSVSPVVFAGRRDARDRAPAPPASPRNSQPASRRSARIGGNMRRRRRRGRAAGSRSRRRSPVRRILALTAIVARLFRVGGAVDIGVAEAIRWAITGIRLSRWTRSISEGPPRGTMMSMAPLMVSITPTAARSVVGTSWIAASGRPAARSPSCRPATSAREEWKLSEPPRRIAALPDLRRARRRRRSRSGGSRR